MKKKWVLFVVFLVSSYCVHANNSIDDVLTTVGENVSASMKVNQIVCVLDFNTPTKDMSEYIQTELVSKLLDFGRLRVVTRAEMDRVDRELNYQMSGYVSDDTALSICERLGANAIVFGKLQELDNNYDLQVKVLDVEQGSYLMFKKFRVSRSSKTEQLLGRSSNYCKTSMGIIVEADKNSISSIAPAIGLYFDYNLTRKLAFGFKGILSSDVANKENSIYTIEPIGLVRYYLVSPSGEPSTGVFVEGDCGLSLILVNNNTRTCFNGGAAIGFRKEVSSFYLEPCMRFGYPYLFGVGLSLGLRF